MYRSYVVLLGKTASKVSWNPLRNFGKLFEPHQKKHSVVHPNISGFTTIRSPELFQNNSRNPCSGFAAQFDAAYYPRCRLLNLLVNCCLYL